MTPSFFFEKWNTDFPFRVARCQSGPEENFSTGQAIIDSKGGDRPPVAPMGKRYPSASGPRTR